MEFSAQSPRNHKKLMIVAIVALVVLVGAVELKRRTVQDQLARLTVRLEQLQTGNRQQNQEAADRIIKKVRKHISIPEGVEPTVATIVDIETLRERNPFYEKAENGDHLIVTTDRAILYNSTKDLILDVVPVQLQKEAAASDEPAV